MVEEQGVGRPARARQVPFSQVPAKSGGDDVTAAAGLRPRKFREEATLHSGAAEEKPAKSEPCRAVPAKSERLRGAHVRKVVAESDQPRAGPEPEGWKFGRRRHQLRARRSVRESHIGGKSRDEESVRGESEEEARDCADPGEFQEELELHEQGGKGEFGGEAER